MWGWPYSLTTLGGSFQVDLQERWKSLWAKSPQRGHMDKIDAKLPLHSFLAATNHLSRAETSVLMQLRMGHIPLNAFLHRIGRADSPGCPTCQHTNKMIHHYLFDCPGHVQARHSLVRALGWNSKSIRHLLGNWQSYKSVLKYVHMTGRFKSIYGDLPMWPAPDGAPPP